MSNKPKAPKFIEGKPYHFSLYSDINEAENRSADIGFPIFCCGWGKDGTIYIGGGGGARGTGVRSAVVACRLIDAVGIDHNSHAEALIDPILLPHTPLPAHPQLQIVGEVSTFNEIVFAMREHSFGDTTKLVCSVGGSVVIFEASGVGCVASSPLPPFLSRQENSSHTPVYTNQDTETSSRVFTVKTPFKSPLLSQLSHTPLKSVLSSFTAHGRKTLKTVMRFKTDFHAEDSFQAVSSLTHDGKILVSGGQDGLIRAFLLDDPDLEYTAVSATTLNADGGMNTPAKGSVIFPPYVSPKCLVVGRFDEGVLSLTINRDSTLVASVGEGCIDHLCVWALPSVEELAQYGVRIPNDYVDNAGYCNTTPGGPKNKRGETPIPMDPNSSYAISHTNSDRLKPVLVIESVKNCQFKQLQFWTPPIIDPRTLPKSSLGIFEDDVGYDPSLDVSREVQRINDLPERRPPHHTLLGLWNENRKGSSLCEWEVSSGTSYTQQLNSPYTIRFNNKTKTVSGDKSGNTTVRLVHDKIISPTEAAAQLCISPNGHYIGISTENLYVFTGPDHPYVRNLHLRAQKLPCPASLAALPPLTLVCERKKCFELACTGLSFDPCSRLLVAVSASRFVPFLPIKHDVKPSCISRGCTRVRKTCCSGLSQWFLVLINILIIAWIASLVHIYSQSVKQIEEDQYFH